MIGAGAADDPNQTMPIHLKARRAVIQRFTTARRAFRPINTIPQERANHSASIIGSFGSLAPPKSSPFSPVRRLTPGSGRSVSGRISPLPGYAFLALYPGSDHPVRILGKFVYLIQGQSEMICH